MTEMQFSFAEVKDVSASIFLCKSKETRFLGFIAVTIFIDMYVFVMSFFVLVL